MLVDNNREIDDNGSVLFNEEGLIQCMNMFSGDINGMSVMSESLMKSFNKHALNSDCDVRLENSNINHTDNQSKWNFSDEYRELNLHDYFNNKLKSISTGKSADWVSIRYNRIQYELDLVVKRSVTDLMRWCIWFCDHMQNENLFFGLGRGSSCSVYILYLIDLHMVDSVEYNLDCIEFFKKQ